MFYIHHVVLFANQHRILYLTCILVSKVMNSFILVKYMEEHMAFKIKQKLKPPSRTPKEPLEEKNKNKVWLIYYCFCTLSCVNRAIIYYLPKRRI